MKSLFPRSNPLRSNRSFLNVSNGGHLKIKLFPAKSLFAGNSPKSMTSERMLTDDGRCCCRCKFFFLCYITNHLMTGPSGNSSFCFPIISMFPTPAPRGNIEIIEKQNKLFPSGPVIKCLWSKMVFLSYLMSRIQSFRILKRGQNALLSVLLLSSNDNKEKLMENDVVLTHA